MRLFQFPYSIPGQWVTALTLVGLMLGGPGCQSVTDITAPVGDDESLTGVLINTDKSKDVLGGLVLPDGSQVFVFGTYNDLGGVDDVQAATLRDKDGQEAALILEGNLPVRARGFDGSTIDISYEEVSDERLAGSVEVFFAAANETQVLTFDVDLKMAAAELARVVEELTGIEISDDELPPDPRERLRLADPSTIPVGKEMRQAQLFFYLLFTYAFAAAGFVMVSVMSQLMKAYIAAFVGVIAAITQATIIVAFTPFIILGDILRLALVEPVITIDFDLVPSQIEISIRPDF